MKNLDRLSSQDYQSRTMNITGKKKQTSFFGLIMSSEELENIVTTGSISGKRDR